MVKENLRFSIWTKKSGYDVPMGEYIIKNDIINSGLVDYLNVDSEEKKELLKPILYRCIFSMDRNDAYNKYQYAFSLQSVYQHLRTQNCYTSLQNKNKNNFFKT